MTKWDRLIAARRTKHWSQLEAAEYVNVGLVTYQRWEAGKAKPQPQHIRHLYEVFGASLDYEEMAFSQDISSHQNISTPSSITSERKNTSEETPGVVLSTEEINEPQAFITAYTTAYLWPLAFMDHPTLNDKQDAIRQAIKELDAMNTNNTNHQITRREALCSLATLPMMTLGLTTSGKEVQPAHYGSVLAQSAASLEACWELYKNSNASDITLAFQCASTYLPVLQAIIKDSSQYRKDALDLAARYALLKTILGWSCVTTTGTIPYAKDAITLSNATGDISLQLSAYSKLAWAYHYDKKYPLALTTAQQAEKLLQKHLQAPNVQSLHPCVQGGTYSTLAVMQAKNRQSPEAALEKASATDPGNECCAFMDFSQSTLLLEAGWTYLFSGNQTKTMQTLGMRIDPETLASKMGSEWGRVESINIMARSALKAREKEQAIHFWIAGIEGAKALKNTSCFNDALATYDLMEEVWSGDASIRDLRDHIAHWE